MPKPPPAAPARQTKLGLSIKTVELPNGLRVVLVNDPHASEVQVTMRYRVGAGDDLEYPGIAHLVEHLMFEQMLGGQTLMAHLEDNASYHNAFTSFDSTTYISRARPEYLDKLLSIEAVRLGFRCTSITDSAFEREREVVKREIELRDDSIELMTALHAAVYPDGHPYRQSIGGSVETVAAITRAQACAFADAYYAPGNAALVISGNVSADRVESALGKFLARIPKRLGAAANTVQPPRKLPMREIAGPVDEQTLLLSWPVPADPYKQLTLRLIAAVTSSAIDSRIKGRIDFLELGDVRAPTMAFRIEPRYGETAEEVLTTVREVLEAVPGNFTERTYSRRAFDRLRQNAIYDQYASLEDGSGRDASLAAHVLAGRDPSAALADEFRALRNLGGQYAAAIVREHFTFDDATVVKLKPNSGKKRGRAITLRKAVHDMGQRRSAPDLARAHAADTSVAVTPVNLQTRVLANGLKVVLVPLSTVPTVDMRLVFGAGSADEPGDKRGTALLATSLTFDLRHLNDVLSFYVAGGSQDLDVTRDRTSFIVRGVDMHLDYLLAGLRRWAVDGRYSNFSDTLAAIIKHARKNVDEDEDDTLTDAWRAALYGNHHPYAQASLAHHISSSLTVDDVQQFRRRFFTPDNATLVIAGRFDVALANQWIDYLFTDWRGHMLTRHVPTPKLAATSLAKVEDLTQMQVRLAIPVRSGTHAQRVVAAAMIDDIARDVRHQLGASYGFGAILDESRVATNILVGGWIDPTRASEVVQLLRDRLQQLRDKPEDAARAFIIARGRVITTLASLTGSASLLAARVETDLELGRSPLSDLQTAKDVQALTLEQMTPLLADLDLSRAAMLMRGPADSVKGAYAALGREPTLVRFERSAAQDAADEPIQRASATRPEATSSDDDWIYVSELEEALTDQSLPLMPFLEINISANLTTSNVSNLIPPMQMAPVDGGGSGVTFVGEVGYRFHKRFSAGAAFGAGSLSGTYDRKALGVVVETKPYTVAPIDLAAFAHARFLARAWGGLLLGVHFDGARFDAERTWTNSFGLGLEIGYDVIHYGPHWLSVLARGTASYGSIGYGALSIGVAYRH